MPSRVLPVVLAGSLLLTSCTAHKTAPVPLPAATLSAVAPSPGSSAPTVARKPPVVVLDPGHNGGNASHSREINKPVPAGRGETKPCNTTGTATKSGYAEHAFNWDVAQRTGALLIAHGVLVQYTRQDDDGVGPCVDQRAAFGNASGAAAVVAVHADGSNSSSAHGFHVSYSDPPLNESQGQPSVSLAEALRDGLRQAGFPTSTYLGENGLYPRSDLAGLNLSTRPAALVECGNMRNPGEAAAMSSPDGRARYAQALATAILAYLKL